MIAMEWLNYHHLLYFWTVARLGSVTAAAGELRLAQSTVSAQIHQLEAVLGERLLRREGRRLVLTDAGRRAFDYAAEIFALGRELVDTVKGTSGGRPARLVVGIADQMPKRIVYRLLEPALRLLPSIHLVCTEGKPDDLFAQLALHRVDVVLTDSPIAPSVAVRGFNHLLGECGITFFAPRRLSERPRRRFPRCLDDAPVLLPAERTTLRRGLDQWLRARDLRPRVVAEFEDSALLKAFGQAGAGYFPGPTAIEREIALQYDARIAGRVPEVRERFYAVSIERRLKHPAIVAISEAARTDLLA
ncbi:MAG TPA: transcriptional activator NhaR [Candidatus Binatia bacterium]|nr:transcriptional activator NhaR [Candidatus Binatia bacterium]